MDNDSTQTLKNSTHASSVTRNLMTLDTKKYLFYLCGMTIVETAIQNPIHIMLTKKQTVHNNISSFECFRQIYKYNKGLFMRGFVPLTIGTCLSQTVHLYGFEYFKYYSYFSNKDSNVLFAGMTSDFISRFIYYPFSLVNTKQIVYKKNIKAFLICKKMYKDKGFLSLYKGFGLYIVCGSMWSGVWWVLYEKSKYNAYIISNTNDSLAINSCCSLGSTITTTTIFNPYVMITTRIQANKNSTYKNVVSHLYKQYGIKGFWRSTPLNIWSYAFGDLLLCNTHEYAKLWSDI